MLSPDCRADSTMNQKRNPKARGRKTLRQKTSTGKDALEVLPNYVGAGVPHTPLANLSRFVTVPDRVLIRLRYPVIVQIVNAGGLVASNSYNINGVYDVDPLLASTNTPGFAEWSQFYRQNQVASVALHGSVSNLETQPMAVFCQAQPTTIAANALGRALVGNRFSRDLGVISPKGGQDRIFFKQKIDLATLFGDPDTYWGTLNNYKGTGASNPSTLFQWALGCQSSTGVQTVGVLASFWIEFLVVFSNPIYLTS